MSPVLNHYWAKAPDVLKNMLGVLLRLCQHFTGFVGDIAKIYNTIGASELDQHTHRFLWRDMDLHRKPKHCARTMITSGDRPSGLFVSDH